MKALMLLVFCGLWHGHLRAQFIYSPLPVKQSDFKKILALGITKCYVYKSGTDKLLVQEAEYGALGLIAALYDKGTNDAGDSINTTELIYKFDGKGRLIHTSYINKLEGGQEEPSLYTYNAAGKLLKRETAQIDPPTYNYKYDGAGHLKEIYVTQRMPDYDKDGAFHGKSFEAPSCRYTYRYDSKARLSEEWQYNLRDGSKTPSYKCKWTYDATGKVIMLQRYSGDGTETLKQTFLYNSDGLLASSDSKENEEVVHYLYEYCKGCKQSWMQ